MTDARSAAAFYSPPNEIEPSALEGAAGELLTLLVARLETGITRTLLPARVGGATRWYGFAPTDREARLLREEFRCWLGPPLSARPANVENATDPVDQAARLLIPSGTVLRVDITDGWQADARSNVASLTDVWTLAPERGLDVPRPVGRVLRQFYESILAVDRSLAEAALDEIKSRSLLSSTNLRFLRVELLSEMGTAQELRDDPALRTISLLARPPAVTERVAEAADALLIEPGLGGDGHSADWTGIAVALEEAWPGLVTHRSQVTTGATARCLVLSELLAETPRQPLLDEISQRFPDDRVVSAATALLLGSPRGPERSTSALGLYHQGDYGAALLAAEALPVRASVSVALAAAVNLGDGKSAVRALALLERLSEQERELVLEAAVERSFYDQLLGRTSDAKVPVGWLDWLAGDWNDRPDLLVDWARQWPRAPEDIERDSAALAEELLDALNDNRRGRVRNGLPVFVDWLVRDGLLPSSVSLATTIFDILLSSEPGKIERQASLVLLDESLAAGCSSKEYVEIVDALSRQLRLLGPRDAPWLAQSLDLLLLFTSQDLSRRDALFAESLGVAKSWSERIEATHAALLRYVFADAGLDLAIPTTAPALGNDADVVRPFLSVGIYSLREGVAKVASKWIKDIWPDVEIKASAAHASNDSLTALVRASDVMLVQTSHAKHAATQAIETAAIDRSRLVFVHGRGATALVRALLAWYNGDTAV